MTIAFEHARLFSFLLAEYITECDDWFELLDTAWTRDIRIHSNILWGDTAEAEEKERPWAEIDKKIDDLDEKLSDWQYEKFHLEKLRYWLRDALREARHETAA